MNEGQAIRFTALCPSSRRSKCAGAVLLPGVFWVISVMIPLAVFMRLTFMHRTFEEGLNLLSQVMRPVGAGRSQNGEKT